MNFNISGGFILRRHNEPELKITPEKLFNTGFVNDLVHEIRKTPGHEPVLTTAECLLSAANTLRVQEAADEGKFCVALE